MEDIFERSIERGNTSRQNSVSLVRHNEDYVAPILDFTTEVFSNPQIKYNHIHLIYYEPDTDADIVAASLRRSRSIVSNSLMSCINTTTNSTECRSDAGATTCCTCLSTSTSDEQHDSIGRHRNSAVGIPIPTEDPNGCKKLHMRPLRKENSKHTDAHAAHPSCFGESIANIEYSSSPATTSSNDTFIDFYSYADMLSNESTEDCWRYNEIDGFSFDSITTLNPPEPAHMGSITMEDYVNCIARGEEWCT